MRGMKHDGEKRVELYLHGSLLVLTGEEIWQMVRHEPETWQRALKRGKGVRRARATEAREARQQDGGKSA